MNADVITTIPNFQPRERFFLPISYTLTTWEDLKRFYVDLLERKIDSLEILKQWMKDRSELESFVSEDMGWRYIKMTCHTDNQEFKESFQYFVNEIEPNISPISNQLDIKFFQSPFSQMLEDEADKILLKKIKTDISIFRDENIPLFTEMQLKQQVYGETCGAMTVEFEGKELTLQQAGVKLQSTDRNEREKIYYAINNRRIQDKEKLDQLLSELIKIRHQVAVNAGFENYRDYMFAAMHRFDYTPQDCFDFHEAVKESVVPFLNERAALRKKKLGLDSLKPWDLSVDPDSKPPLKPFKNGEELLLKTIECFDKMNPFMGLCLREMDKMKRFDLESRKAKAPGGYNYPLDESGVPFIFMNAAGTLQDLVTMLHEGGHALHSILTKDLALNSYRNLTSEIAELASMSMELLSIKHWDIFFPNPDELNRAVTSHIEQAVQTLPWVATIDKFQHWLYTNPNHSIEERNHKWVEIYSEFAIESLDWEGLEHYRRNIWQKQLHIYEVPFYYIEYGIAQLGAFSVWKNSEENYEKAINDYVEALKLGYTLPIAKVYEKASVPFNFKKEHIKNLMTFVKAKF
ncbi:MAG: M3 family oligoendopeptidase [Cytophagales bacterium]